LKTGDLVCWPVTLDHVVLKSEIGKIAVQRILYSIYIYIYIWKVAVVTSSDALIMHLPEGSGGNYE
jgi:hypothetical protein